MDMKETNKILRRPKIKKLFNSQTFEEANKQIELIKNWYKENQRYFQITDLKLRNAYAYTKSEHFRKKYPFCAKSKSIFTYFCDEEFTCWKTILLTKGIDVEDYIRFVCDRDGDFYLYKKNIFEKDYKEKGNISWDYSLINIVDKILYENKTMGVLSFYKNGNINKKASIDDNYSTDNKDYFIEKAEKEIEWFASGKALEDIKKFFANTFIILDSIEDVKDTQIERLHTFLTRTEIELSAMNSNEKNEKTRDELIAKFPTKTEREIYKKSNLSIQDLEKLLSVARFFA